MADARKCDSCGIYYEISPNRESTGIVYYRDNIDGSRSPNPVVVDLCPNCMKSLQSFIKSSCTLMPNPKREAVIKAYKELLAGSECAIDAALGYLGEALDG